MPIFMFDKDNDFVVMKLEAVSNPITNLSMIDCVAILLTLHHKQLLPLSFGPEQLPRAGSAGAAK